VPQPSVFWIARKADNLGVGNPPAHILQNGCKQRFVAEIFHASVTEYTYLSSGF